jgi:hypothetical protein
MTFRIWNGLNGEWTTPTNWYPTGAPQPGDTVGITAGNVRMSGADTSRDTIFVDAFQGKTHTELTLKGDSLGYGSTTYLVGYGNVAFLTLNNAVTSGVVVDSYGSGEVDVPKGAYAVNFGWWAISSTTQSQIFTYARGNFINAGAIESGPHGDFSLYMPTDQQNYGVYQTDPGGRMMFLSGDGHPETFKTLTNFGNIFVNGGLTYMSTNVVQADAAKTTISGGGTLTLAGTYSGGTIEINSGTLNFIPDHNRPGPYSASELKSDIMFTGDGGKIDLGEAILSANYNPDTNDLVVLVPWKGGPGARAADFHLAGGAGAYSAANFDVDQKLGTITYHHNT